MGILKILGNKPWEASGEIDNVEGGGVIDAPSARVGLWVFLAVAASLFGLFSSAYHMRAEYADWQQLQVPAVLWLNTFVLILASVAFQWAWMASRQGRLKAVRDGLSLGGLLTLAFLILQLLAWNQMINAGFFAQGNPANAFFYLLTGLHGLHLVGGLWVWQRTTSRSWAGLDQEDAEQVGAFRLRVELCAIYWHFLLLVWLVLFGMMLST
ncbi:MAG: cytochrome c oxidase subunit 3 [Gammaproteobacteria bacterium]